VNADADLSRAIIDTCLAMGFADAGICEARPSEFREELGRWLGAGRQGTMDWLAETAGQRLDIETFLPGARSIIMVADQYATPGDDAGASGERGVAGTAPPTGRIARYALGRDYHRTISGRLHRLADALRRLHPGGGARFRSFVDSSPVFEREHARRAGLGWIGKHTLLIHPERGSYMLLGGIATTLALTPSVVAAVRSPDYCGSCTRCIDACPTGAITPYSVDGSRCISYLTIEHEGPIEPGFHGPIGEWLLGCDICQEVCPFNAPPSACAKGLGERTPDVRINPAYSSPNTRIASRFDLAEMLGWTSADRATRLTSSAVKRATLDVLKRNALVIVGNRLASRTDAALLERVRAIAADDREPAVVRATAEQVLSRLGAGGG
jgi:epoxyqueuosine reductase